MFYFEFPQFPMVNIIDEIKNYITQFQELNFKNMKTVSVKGGEQMFLF